MSYYYNNRLTAEGLPRDVIDFTVRVVGKEPASCKTQTSPPPVLQSLAFSRLVRPPLLKDKGCGNCFSREWMADWWGCTSYAFDVSRRLLDFDNDNGAPVRAVYNFKTLGGPPQLWVLKASRNYPRIVFTLEYDINLGPGRYNGPAGKMVYQDGRYLEALVQNALVGGKRETLRALRFGPDAQRVALDDNP